MLGTDGTTNNFLIVPALRELGATGKTTTQTVIPREESDLMEECTQACWTPRRARSVILFRRSFQETSQPTSWKIRIMALDAGPGMSGHKPKHADGQAWQVGLRKYKLLSAEKMGTRAQELKVRWEGPIFSASVENLLPIFLRGWCPHVPWNLTLGWKGLISVKNWQISVLPEDRFFKREFYLFGTI